MRSARDNKRRLGVVTVEAALVFPLLLLLTMGMIEYSWMFLKAEEVTSVARRAVRLAIAADSTNSEVDALITEMMSARGLSGYQATVTPGDLSGSSPGDVVTVEISFPYGNVALLNTPIVPTPSTLEASVSMAREGP
ncbi:MAG: TadE/TadG family type IV pilus assembly protein [Planctomycetota bacterium]